MNRKVRRKILADFNVARLRHDMDFLRQRGCEFYFEVHDDGRLTGDDGQELDSREVGQVIAVISATKAGFLRRVRNLS